MIAGEIAEKRVEDFIEECRRRGIKATHQRMEILRELAGTQEHPDVETIYNAVKKHIPAISLDTVYRTLRMMEDMGVIARVGALDDRSRFDANTDHHHHFVCLECGKVRDFYSEELEHFKAPPEVSRMGNIDSVYVELRGVCKSCREKMKNMN